MLTNPLPQKPLHLGPFELPARSNQDPTLLCSSKSPTVLVTASSNPRATNAEQATPTDQPIHPNGPLPVELPSRDPETISPTQLRHEKRLLQLSPTRRSCGEDGSTKLGTTKR